MTRINILQLNLGGRRIVADEFHALSTRYDITAIQEPTCRGNKVTGFGFTSRVIALSSGERRPRAAIVINNPNLDVMDLRHHISADHAACYIRWGSIAFTLVSAYLPDKLLRARMMRAAGIYVLTEAELPQLVSEENFPRFLDFIHGWKEHFGTGPI